MEFTQEVESKNGKSWITALIIGLCIVISSALLAWGVTNMRKTEHSITATGSASVDFDSNLITWGGSFMVHAATTTSAYNQISKDAEIVKKYLLDNGINESDMAFSSIDITRRSKDIYDDNGNYIGSEPDGYDLQQTVSIQSSDVFTVEAISRDISSILQSGVEFTSDSPEYYYTDLDSLKLDLIDKASKNAMDRINIIAANSNAKLGKLKNSSLGVFQITARNSGTSDYSYDGAFNTSSYAKTATITVRLEYDLN